MEHTPSPPKQEHRAPDWFQRNWFWVVPASWLIGITVFVGFFALIGFFLLNSFKSSEPYQQALEKVGSEPSVRAFIGEPLEARFMVSGQIRDTGPSGRADLAIPVFGPEGRGLIFVAADKSAGQWTFSRLVFEDEESGDRIDLLNLGREPESGPPSEPWDGF